MRWFRAEQARLTFKKWVMAAAAGFDAIVLGYEQDRPTYQNPDFGLRDLAFQGMTEPGDGPPRQWPAIYALAMAQSQLGGYASVTPMPALESGVLGFEFTVEGQTANAMWYDDGVAQGPDDPPVSTLIHLSTPETRLLMFTLPTEMGQVSPDVQILTPQNGLVTLTLTETPIVIRGRIEMTTGPTLFLPLISG